MKRIRRYAAVLGGVIGMLAGFSALAPAFAMIPGSGGAADGPANSPAVVRTVVVGGMPGWQIALIAIASAVHRRSRRRHRRPRPATPPGHHARLRHRDLNRSNDMPRFMDFHEDLKLPPEAIEQIADDARNARADEFGVRQIELFHNPDGKVYCLLEGADEEAIRRHHAALGVPCGDVHQVTGLG